MNSYEKDEISRLPSKYRPMGAWSYFGYQILFALPIIGQIALLICALSGNNINRRSFARSYFCGLIICVILGAIAIGIVFALGGLDAILGGGN